MLSEESATLFREIFSCLRNGVTVACFYGIADLFFAYRFSHKATSALRLIMLIGSMALFCMNVMMVSQDPKLFFYCSILTIALSLTCYTLLLHRGNMTLMAAMLLLCISIRLQMQTVERGLWWMIGMTDYTVRKGLTELVCFLLYLYFRKRPDVRNGLKTAPKDSVYILILVYAVSVFFAMLIISKYRQDIALYFLAGCIMMVMNLSVLFFCNKLAKAHQEQVRMQGILVRQQADIDVTHQSEEMHHQLHTMRHEMRNHAQLIRALYEHGQLDELGDYLRSLDKQIASLAAPVKSGNVIVDAVLCQKISQAEREGIPFCVQAQMPEATTIRDMDICSLLSNLINNAIEASQRLEAPQVDVIIHPVKNYLMVSVKNRIEEDVLAKNPDLDTTKTEPGHGIGVQVIRRIVEKYDGILSFRSDGGIFSAEALLRLNAGLQRAS